MPFKSKAQRRKFAEMMVRGEISHETFEEWNRETGDAKLPERVTKPGRKTAKRRATSRATPRAKTPTRRRTSARKTTARKAKRSRSG